MSDGIMITIGDDGEATLYDDTYDITIHCESKEEQDEVRKALENISHWIPVTERLPEYGEEVLTITQDDVYEVNHVIDDVHDEWFWEDNGDVIAWMPLPEPYKGVTT